MDSKRLFNGRLPFTTLNGMLQHDWFLLGKPAKNSVSQVSLGPVERLEVLPRGGYPVPALQGPVSATTLWVRELIGTTPPPPRKYFALAMGGNPIRSNDSAKPERSGLYWDGFGKNPRPCGEACHVGLHISEIID